MSVIEMPCSQKVKSALYLTFCNAIAFSEEYIGLYRNEVFRIMHDILHFVGIIKDKLQRVVHIAKNVCMMINLKAARQKAGLKQKDLADQLNLSPKTISNYEAGTRDPDLNTLIKLAHILNVTIDYLVGLEQKTLVEQIQERVGDLQREELIDFLNEYIEVIAKLK